MSRKKFSPMGNDLFGDAITTSKLRLFQKYTIPPFSILNTTLGDWVKRKSAWLSLGIVGETGRDDNLMGFSDTINQGLKFKDGIASTGTSIFDPVLSELCYDWFCPRGGQIVDPFCGGSVRGIVASMLGMKYWGADLRQEQVDANVEQGQKICHANMPVWFCGNSLDVIPSAPNADFIFSCPPYFDLEVYSDDPRDLSAMAWNKFLYSYQAIIRMCCERLKPNRFAAFVVGDVRDKDGFYRNFHGETIRAFDLAGLRFYNHGILLNQVGTAPLRTSRIFDPSRKLIKIHQDVLVFVKGDWREAVSAVNNPIPPRPVKIPARPVK